MSVDCIVTVEEIEKAVMSVSDYIEEISEKERSWTNLSEEDLWYLLVSCILGSRVASETASACASHLYQKKLLNPSRIISNPIKSEKHLSNELSRPIFPPANAKGGRRYQYPKSKSKYIVRTAIEIYERSNTSLNNLLMDCKNEYEAREILLEKAIGIGYKQASLFLRNISFSQNLAVLDSHVIKYMTLLGMVNGCQNPITLNRGIYLKLENILLEYAFENGKSISTLDIAIWVVMRVIQKEFIIWQS